MCEPCSTTDGIPARRQWEAATRSAEYADLRKLMGLASEVVALADDVAHRLPRSPMAEYLTEDEVASMGQDLSAFAWNANMFAGCLGSVLPVVSETEWAELAEGVCPPPARLGGKRRELTHGEVTELQLQALADTLHAARHCAELTWTDDGTISPELALKARLASATEWAIAKAEEAVQDTGYTGHNQHPTLGALLRRAADLLDRIDYGTGADCGEEGLTCADGRRMTAEELYPFILREKNERAQRWCPQCGGERHATLCVFAADATQWNCDSCGGDTRTAREVVHGKRKKAKRAKKAKAPAKTAANADPAGTVLPPPNIPTPPKPKPRPKPRMEHAPKLHNRIAGLTD